MKRILIYIITIVVILFTACAGDEMPNTGSLFDFNSYSEMAQYIIDIHGSENSFNIDDLWSSNKMLTLYYNDEELLPNEDGLTLEIPIDQYYENSEYPCNYVICTQPNGWTSSISIYVSYIKEKYRKYSANATNILEYYKTRNNSGEKSKAELEYNEELQAIINEQEKICVYSWRFQKQSGLLPSKTHSLRFIIDELFVVEVRIYENRNELLDLMGKLSFRTKTLTDYIQ